MVTGTQSSQAAQDALARLKNQQQQDSAPKQDANSAEAGTTNQLTDRQRAPVNPSLAAAEANQEEAKEDKKVSKTVFHGIPGSNYIDPTGGVHVFDYKGELETDDAVVVRELKKIQDKPGSRVYSQNQRGPVAAPGDDQAFKEIKARAEQTVADLQRQAQR